MILPITSASMLVCLRTRGETSVTLLPGVEGTPDYTKCLTRDEKWLFVNDYLQFGNEKVCDVRIAAMLKNLPLFEAVS